MSGPQVKWELVGDATKSHTAIDSVSNKAQGLTGKLQGVGKGMVIGAGIGAFNLLTGAIDMAIGKLGEARQAFLDDQVSQTLLAQALKNNIPNWDGNIAGAEAYATAQARLGFTDDEVRTSIGQLVGVTHDLSEAQNLNTLAEELARAKGIDLATATDIVTKAHEGNGKALKGLGVDVAGLKTGAELLDAIQKNVKGSAEAWAQTSEGKTAVSQVKVGEAMEKVGGIIDRVATVVLPILADAFSVVVDIIGNVIDAISPLVREIAQRLQPVIQAVGPIAKTVFGVIGTAVGVLGTVFGTVFGAIGTVVGVLSRVFGTFADFVGNVFGTIAGFVKAPINFVIGLINNVIDAINGIQVHIHVGPVDLDWNGLNLGHLPKLHMGGIVPGVEGTEVPIMALAGERVSRVGEGGGGQVINIFIDTMIGTDGPVLDELARQLSQRLRVSLA